MGIFDNEANLFAVYEAELEFRDKIMGGTPKNPKLIHGWLRAKTGISDEDELQRAMLRTLRELGAVLPENPSWEEIEKASEELAQTNQGVGFKRDERGPYIESRTVKAMLKESVNVLYVGDKWTADANRSDGKSPRSFVAERVFVDPDTIWLGCSEPTGVELFVGHTQSAKGPQSNLTLYEYVIQPRITFRVRVAEDSVPQEAWKFIWRHAQENGLGALRSQGHGRFDIVRWDLVQAAERVPTFKPIKPPKGAAGNGVVRPTLPAIANVVMQ